MNNHIEIRADLAEMEQVMELADYIGLDEYSTVGGLIALWSWAVRQAGNGVPNSTGVMAWTINRLVGVEGFAEAMLRAGLLQRAEDKEGNELESFYFKGHGELWQ